MTTAADVVKGERLKPHELASLIIVFLESRNGGELRDAFGSMRVRDRDLMLDELATILEHGGWPPKWVKR